MTDLIVPVTLTAIIVGIISLPFIVPGFQKAVRDQDWFRAYGLAGVFAILEFVSVAVICRLFTP